MTPFAVHIMGHTKIADRQKRIDKGEDIDTVNGCYRENDVFVERINHYAPRKQGQTGREHFRFAMAYNLKLLGLIFSL